MKRIFRSDEKIFETSKQFGDIFSKYLKLKETEDDGLDWEMLYGNDENIPEIKGKEAVVDKSCDGNAPYLKTYELMNYSPKKQKMEIRKVVPEKWMDDMQIAFQERIKEVAKLNLPYWSYEETWETHESTEAQKIVFAENSVTFSASSTHKSKSHSKRILTERSDDYNSNLLINRTRSNNNHTLHSDATLHIRPTLSDYIRTNVQGNNQSIHLNFVFNQPCGADFFETFNDLCGFNSLAGASLESMKGALIHLKGPQTIKEEEEKREIIDLTGGDFSKDNQINCTNESFTMDNESGIEFMQLNEAVKIPIENSDCNQRAKVSNVVEETQKHEDKDISSDEDILDYGPNYTRLQQTTNMTKNQKTNLTLPLERCTLVSKDFSMSKASPKVVTETEKIKALRKEVFGFSSSDSE